MTTATSLRRRPGPVYVSVDVEICLDEISTKDLQNELASRGTDSSAEPLDIDREALAHIWTLQLCGQRAAAEAEALALVERQITHLFRSTS